MSKIKSRYKEKTAKIIVKIVRTLERWLGLDVSSKFREQNLLTSNSKSPKRNDEDILIVVDIVYNYFLHRNPDPGGLKYYKDALRKGMPVAEFVNVIASSPERKQKNTPDVEVDHSDGQFLLYIGEILFQGTAARPKEIELYKKYLRENAGSRNALIQQLVGEHIVRLQHGSDVTFDPHNCWIMGTDKFLNKEGWDKRAAALKLPDNRAARSIPLSGRQFQHTGSYQVSAIASLYKGRKFLEAFLDNITSQTMFDRAELIIVDADSPEGEEEIILKYQEVYPNIVYKRINYRLGIYDAWNVGAQLARGRYLTNTNLDDLRRVDSLELQATALDRHAFTDVVYQDFFYSLDSSFGFDDVAKMNFKSDLPIVTCNNMFEFNSPHNAPMWRRKLHDEVGYFDTSLKSAGDYEFWLRCLANGKKFLKINTPHVVYFQNPEGISTAPNSRGVEEARRVWKLYSRQLTSRYLSMSRTDFSAVLGIEPEWDWNMSSYEVVQQQLRSLGDSAKAS